MATTVDNSLFQPGDTLLHRLDPRLKSGACLLLVVFTFAASSWIQLLLPLFLILIAAWQLTPATTSIWRACWILRWLLLFTLLMHVLFSQGRTLLGVSWLSFDGLLSGGLVCVQILLAIVMTTLLSVTTSIEQLVSAFGWFARPLQWLGFRTDEWQKLLLLTFGFVPVVRGEIVTSTGSRMPDGSAAECEGRWAASACRLRCFVLRLVDHADKVAHRVSLEGEQQQVIPALPALLPMALHDKLFASFFLLFMIGYWLIG